MGKNDDGKALRDAIRLMAFTTPPSILDHMLPVLRELEGGNLDALAAYIRDSDYKIHPYVAARIANLISGPAENAGGYQLTLRRAAGTSRRAGTTQQKHERQERIFDIARAMIRHGALDPSGFDSAVEDTMGELDLGRTTITNAWKQVGGRLGKRPQSIEKISQLINNLERNKRPR